MVRGASQTYSGELQLEIHEFTLTLWREDGRPSIIPSRLVENSERSTHTVQL